MIDIVAHVTNAEYAAMLAPYLRSSGVRKVIAVCGRDTADAAEALRAIEAENERLATLELPADFGKGAAWRAGFGASCAEYVAFIDLNGDVSAGLLAAGAAALDDSSVDGVIGVRSTHAPSGGARRFLSAAYRRYLGLLFGPTVHDVQAPFKMFRRDVLEDVFEQLRLFDVGFDAELVWHLTRRGANLREIPMPWSSQPIRYSASSIARTLFSLAVVRASHGKLASSTFLQWIGRHYTIPAKRNYRILIFAWRDIRNSSAGGGEVYLHEQARCWIKDGHQVTWVAQAAKGLAPRESIDGIEIVRPAPFPWIFAAGGLWYLLGRRKKFDFVIDCMNGIPFFTPLFTTKPKIALVYHVHEKHFREELWAPIAACASFVETRLVPFVYRNTSFLTISDSTRADMERINMSRFPIGLIHSGVSSDLVPGAKHPQPTVLYLGRLRAYKRVRKLIDAVWAAQRTLPDARLIIAGTGDDEPALREYVERNGIPNIAFRGKVSDDEKRELMQEAWVFGMPSSMEGWGIVVIEAAACATPAVAFAVGGLRDCILDGKTGILIDEGNDAAFAAAILRILSDAAERARLSAAALEWAREFSWGRAAEETLSMIVLLQPWRAVFRPSGDEWQLVAPKALAPARHKSAFVTK